MQVDDDDATSHISTHARFTFNLMKELKLVLFGAYTYNIVENSQYLPTSVWANGQAYKGTKKMESLLGNMMLTYKKAGKALLRRPVISRTPERDVHGILYHSQQFQHG